MGLKDKRIDDYIAHSADFAKPVLNHLRKLVHAACPQVEETWKWSFPHFAYHGILCSMAAFKHHCAFGFWKAKLMDDYAKLLHPMGETAMGHFGQLKSLKDLPSDKILIQYLKEAARLNSEGINLVRKPKPATSQALVVPPDFRKAIAKSKKAIQTFDAFSNSNKKDYIEWITEAKTDATRLRRMTTAVEWLAEGKIRNWKYA